MTGCITFEEIESRAESTVALAIHARHIRNVLFAHTVGFPLLYVLSRKLRELISGLNTPALERFEDSQLRELADVLKQLHDRLTKVISAARDSELNSFKIIVNLLLRIEESCDDLESIVENIHLAVNPEFHKVVSSAIAKLSVGVEESATLLR